jgi:DNA-binding MarR family transcriptional regulator
LLSRQIADPADGIDARRALWAAELPDLDTRGMAIIGRMRLITLRLRPGIEAIFARHGIDSGEFGVIGTLLRSGPPYCLRPTELFRWLMVSSGGLTAQLTRLEKAGLISREPAADDARSLLVKLTARGREVAERAFREDMQWEAEILSALTESEQAKLAALLHKLAKSLPD